MDEMAIYWLRGNAPAYVKAAIDAQESELRAENARLDAALADTAAQLTDAVQERDEAREALAWLAERVPKLPTWVEEDSYAAQVDMRKRAADLVRFAQAGQRTGGE